MQVFGSKRPRLVALVVTVWAAVFAANAQTPFATQNVGSSSAERSLTLSGPSAGSPWIGGQIAYKFGGSSEFADNLLVAARLLYDIDVGSEKFHLPVMGNISDLTTDVT